MKRTTKSKQKSQTRNSKSMIKKETTKKNKKETKRESTPRVQTTKSTPAPKIKREDPNSTSDKHSNVKTIPKDQYSGKVNTQEISIEISKILRRIEDKKRKGLISSGNNKVNKKVSAIKAKRPLFTAKEYGYRLQRDQTVKNKQIIDLFALRDRLSKPNNTISTYELILSIAEIAANAHFYKLYHKNKSRSFWEDVIKYEDLINIFKGFKAETLRKYWILMNKDDNYMKFIDLMKKVKVSIDSIEIKPLSLVSTILNHLNRRLDELQLFLQKYNEPKKLREEKEAKQKQKEEKEKEKENNNLLNRKTLRIHSSKPRQVFTGIPNNEEIPQPNYNDEKYKEIRKLKQIFYQENKTLFDQLSEEDEQKFDALDKIICKIKEFFQNKYNEEVILSVLKSTSMNLEDTFLFLNTSLPNNKNYFNIVEDALIKSGGDLNDLIKQKGKEAIERRKYFLNIN